MKQLAHITMVVLLSISIVAPSVLSMCSEHYDIEITKDIGEEDSKKEAKKEIEPQDTFFETFSFPQLAMIEDIKHYNSVNYIGDSLFSAKIHLPPPQHIG